jgi:hypothetical protein
VGGWYTIGLAAGLGGSLGVLLAGLAGARRGGMPVATLLALLSGAGVALAFGDWPEAVAGALGGALAAAGATPLVAGALARGGTRVATAVLVAGVAVVLAALAFVPILGYLEPPAVAVLGARLRRRAGRTFAGLRILARD